MSMCDTDSIRIIAAHAGTGKSYLAKKHPEKYIDFVMMPYKYVLPEGPDVLENEANKANSELVINFDFPENYVDAIKQALCETDKTLIIPSAHIVLDELQSLHIPYMLCYPENTEESKTEYERRFLTRGNTEDFLEIFIGGWHNFFYYLEKNEYGEKFVMKPHEYLADVVKPKD